MKAIFKQKSHFDGVESIDRICDVGTTGREIIDSTDFVSQSSYNYRRGRKIAKIIDDMFLPSHFEGKTLLELGPGHFAFALLARSLGANVVCIENDPNFAALGRHLGFEVIQENFFTLEKIKLEKKFDGLFVKGTFNACNSKDDKSLNDFVRKYSSFLLDDAWGWFVTVNKTGRSEVGMNLNDFVEKRIEAQRNAFENNGWLAQPIPEDFDRRQHAMNYSGSKYLYTKNLSIRFD